MSINNKTVFYSILILYAFVVSIIQVKVFYPGIIMSDDWFRWATALHFMGEIEKLEGFEYWTATTWYPPMDPLLKAITFKISNGLGLYTYIQAFLFNILFLYVVSLFKYGKYICFFAPLLYFIPPFLFVGILVSSHTAAVIGLLGMAAITQISNIKAKALRYFIFGACLTGIVTVLFGVRYNALSIIPVLVVICYIWYKADRVVYVIAAGAVAIALVINYSLPKFLPVKKVPVLTATVVWEHTGILKLLVEKNIDISEYRLDEFGDTDLAIRNFDPFRHDTLVFPMGNPESIFPREVLFEKSDLVYSKFKQLVKDYPVYFIKNRVNFYECALGIKREQSKDQWYYPLVWDVYSNYVGTLTGYNYDRKEDSLAAKLQLRNALLVRKNYVNFFYKPIVIFSIAFTVAAICFFFNRRCLVCGDRNYLIPYLLLGLGFFYFIGYFVISPGVIFVYFIPCLVTLWLAIIGFGLSIVDYFINKIKN